MVELSFELIYDDEPPETQGDATDPARGLHPHGG